MARIRTIKPEFPHSESMGRVSRDARLCFIMLWTIADDSGRLRGNSRMLASLLFPYDDDAKTLIGRWLDDLGCEGCITRYVVGSDAYIQINEWAKHQKIDKPSASKIPAPDEYSRILANPREVSSEDLRTKDQGPKDQGEEGDKPRKRVTALVRPDDVAEQVWADWLQLRKTKRAPVTATVLDGARDEAGKAGMPLEQFLGIWCRRGSQGLEAAWLRSDERKPGTGETAYQQSQRERVAEFAPGIAKRSGISNVIDLEAGYVPVIASR